MITRGLTGDYAAACAGAPPPLHVQPDHPGAAWFPLERPELAPHPPGPHAIIAPHVGVGDDPTDPAGQTRLRHTTFGMIPWLDAMASVRVGESGKRP